MTEHVKACPLSEEQRLGAMSAAWDDAAAALQRRDTPAFDQAMSKFNSLKERQ